MFDIPVVRIGVPYLGAAPVGLKRASVFGLRRQLRALKALIAPADQRSRDTVTSLLKCSGCGPNRHCWGNQSRIDSINSFPVETEKPIVSKLARARLAIQIALSGDADERTLKELARDLRDDLARVRGISMAAWVTPPI